MKWERGRRGRGSERGDIEEWGAGSKKFAEAVTELHDLLAGEGAPFRAP